MIVNHLNRANRNTIGRAVSLCVLMLVTSAVALAQTGTGGMQQPGMQNQQQSPAAAQNADMPNAQALDDLAFVKKALQGGEAEVQLGLLAQEKSQSEDVKQFGQKMVQDHTQLGDQVMKPVAEQLGVKEPKGLSKKDKQMLATLGGLSGPQFDQEYIKAMIKDHKEDLKDFKSEEQLTQNPNLKKATEEAETVISQHLRMIEQIAQSHNMAAEAK